MPRPGSGLRASLLCLALLCAVQIAEAPAQERLVRRFAADHGLEVPPVQALVTDPEGTLWIGTLGGLYRFDGVEFRRWAPDRVTSAVAQLAASADGRLAVQVMSGEIFEVTPGGTVRLPPPHGGWSPYVRTLAYDADGRLWSVVGDSALARYDGDGWTELDGATFAGERVRRVLRDAAGGLLVLTDAGLWQLDTPGASPRKRFDTWLYGVASTPDGRLLVLTHDSRVVELTERGSREIASRAAGDLPDGRPISIIERKGTIWVALDRYLVALREGRPPQIIGSQDGLDSGGPLLVDHEGSLWMGGFAALFQFPEPETTIWHEGGGLPGRHTRFVARSGDVLWVTSWQGTARIRRTETGLGASTLTELESRDRPCVDPLGTVWLSTEGAVFRVRGEQIVGRVPVRTEFLSCAAASDPAIWIGTPHGLFLADAGGGTLHPVEALPIGASRVEAVLEDRAGRLWIADGTRACHTTAAHVRETIRTAAGDAARLAGGRPTAGEPSYTGDRSVAREPSTAGESQTAGTGRSTSDPATGLPAVDWACDALPEAGAATSLLELDDGTLWLATRHAGVLARGADGWRPLPANARLATRDVFALVPSPSGGIWIAGQGILQRVRPGGPEGWEVLEAPGPGNGLPAGRGADLVEDDDGTLWITTSVGLVHVPPEARHLPLDPPRVLLMDARVDDEPIPLALTGALELPADRNRLELRFAALSFREPGRVRYQVRLSPDAPWVGTLGQPSFRWVDLPAGRYQAEVRASLDGRTWSAESARFEFRVLPPWYRTPWALALFAALAGLVLWGAYHARTAYLVGLERQRTRIAMDLHDELGSGLGSIGILAGLLPTGRVDEAQRNRIAEEIAATAAELGSALADIVWSLDPRTATLEELATHLAEHGDRLFAGEDVDFRMHAPREWPAAELPLPLRRNVLLIGLEALHNAARHSGARNVTLTWTRHRGWWQLAVSDDGVGLEPDAPDTTRRGRGLAGMRRRAEEIGGSIEWLENPGGGTRVRLRFPIPGLAAPRARTWLTRRRR